MAIRFLNALSKSNKTKGVNVMLMYIESEIKLHK